MRQVVAHLDRNVHRVFTEQVDGAAARAKASSRIEARSRVAVNQVLPFAAIDALLAVGFVVAWVKTPSRELATDEHRLAQLPEGATM